MEGLSRRELLASGAATAAAAALPGGAAAELARESANRPRPPIGRGGAPTSPATLARVARRIGRGDALTFLDLAAFDNNFRHIVSFAKEQNWAVRPALKSFQSPGFIAYTLRRLPQPRGMVFHLRAVDPILRAAPPGTDLMMGYPPSGPELAHFLRTRPPRGAPRHRVRILVDSLELLRELARQAKTSRRPLPIEVALQLESGFYLSGLQTPAELREALRILRANRRRLKLTAVMCYDGHAAAQPPQAFRQVVVDDTRRRFQAWLDQLSAEGKGLYDRRTLVRNGPASSTYRLWAGSPQPNEISPGAGLLFHGYITEDGHDNAGLEPTLHHAAPVHRLAGPPRIPITGTPQPSDKESVSCKGGAWPNNSGSPAAVVHPPGLEEDELSGGRGNNQSNFLAPKGVLRRGDYIVFRPKHAGDAIDYFGGVAAIRNGRVRRYWQTLPRPYSR